MPLIEFRIKRRFRRFISPLLTGLNRRINTKKGKLVMKEIKFPQWAEVLAQTNLSLRQKASWTITLRWYLNFCRRGRAGVTVQSARDFIEWAEKEKHPEAWQLESWKEALNWFFRAAKETGEGGRRNSESGTAVN